MFNSLVKKLIESVTPVASNWMVSSKVDNVIERFSKDGEDIPFVIFNSGQRGNGLSSIQQVHDLDAYFEELKAKVTKHIPKDSEYVYKIKKLGDHITLYGTTTEWIEHAKRYNNHNHWIVIATARKMSETISNLSLSIGKYNLFENKPGVVTSFEDSTTLVSSKTLSNCQKIKELYGVTPHMVYTVFNTGRKAASTYITFTNQGNLAMVLARRETSHPRAGQTILYTPSSRKQLNNIAIETEKYGPYIKITHFGGFYSFLKDGEPYDEKRWEKEVEVFIRTVDAHNRDDIGGLPEW